MASSSDDRSFSAEELRAATSNGHLPAVAERLARGRDLLRLISLYEQAADLAIPAALLTETVQRTAAALGRPGPAGPGGGIDTDADSDDRRAVRLLAGEALLARAAQPALTETDRSALAAAAAVLADAGDLHRAARAFEAADNPAAAADLWGRLGELDAMEACLARDDERRRAVRAGASALRDVEERLASGERVAALRIMHEVPEGVAESRMLRQIALEVGGRMVRTRGITLHVIHGRTVRFATAPAALGRDPLAEVPLRDPGVSRRHAVLSLGPEGITLADTGSRLGTFVAGARLTEPAALGGDIEATLGPSCRLNIGRIGDGADHVIVRGGGGLDAGLLALVGRGRLPVDALIPGAGAAWLEIDSAGVHLGHAPGLTVRLGGHRAAGRIDLLHGDRVDLGDDITIEVP
jgi:FHA domain